LSKKILVVEDQEENRQVLRDLFSMAENEFIEAEDGGSGRCRGAAPPQSDPDGHPIAHH
jgi:two-component system cell cycle response regulator DivK